MLLLDVGGVELVAPPWHDCDVPGLIHAGFIMDWRVKIRIMERSQSHRNLFPGCGEENETGWWGLARGMR